MDTNHFQMFPWSTYDEFKSVSNIILNLEFNSKLLYNLDFLKDLQWTERQLIIWRTKTTSANHLYEIDATHSILNCLLHEFSPKLIKQLNNKSSIKTNDLINDDLNKDLNENTSVQTEPDSSELWIFNNSSFNLINEETLSCLYASSILKFFKMLSYYDIIDGEIERLLSRSEANLVKVCEKLDFPKYIIEYRHRIAHNKLPSFDQLRLACQIALNWIKRNYWSKYLNLLDNQEKSKQQIYEQTMMVLTSLFEQNEDNLDKINQKSDNRLINKKLERPTKKQKVELKKFNSLDKKQINLLNDTLYDLLNEDFYSTLHAVTLYIVSSTKNQLDSITVDQMAKWIEQDEENMNMILNMNNPIPNEHSSKKAVSNQHSIKEKKKKDQLIPNYILNSFKPIFEIINRQLSSINQLLIYLHSIIEDQKMDLKTSAQIWFIQIICALLNNLNQKESQDKNKMNIVLTDFERCFKLSDSQSTDLRWVHLFTVLTEEPIMGKINLNLAKRFYPLVSFRYEKNKFDKICDLLAIYLDLNGSDNYGSRKKKMVGDSKMDEDIDLNKLETLLPKDQLNLRSPACKKSKQISLFQELPVHNSSTQSNFSEQNSSVHNPFSNNSSAINSSLYNNYHLEVDKAKKNLDYVCFNDVLDNQPSITNLLQNNLIKDDSKNTEATNNSTGLYANDKNVTKLHIFSERTNETNSSSNRMKYFLTSSQEVDDVEYWTLKCNRLNKELEQALDELDELENENELLESELIEFLKLSKESLKLKKLLQLL